MCPNHNSRQQFLALSATFTGFSGAQLEATGLVDTYFKVVNNIINTEIMGALLLEYEKITQNNIDINSQSFGILLEDQKFDPLIKNIITLWYLGQWNQMPQSWRNNFGASALDRDHIISAQAYKQGLVWEAMGAHPMGTRQQGFGAWSLPPPGPPR